MEMQGFLFFAVGMVVFYFLGTWFKRFVLSKGGGLDGGIQTVEGSLLALFAFFLGFTFSISANKVEGVRVSSVNEANAISTVLARTDLYSDSTAKDLRLLVKEFLQKRIAYFDENVDLEQQQKLHLNSEDAFNKTWEHAVLLAKNPENTLASKMLIPALNQMGDAMTRRDADIKAKLPASIMWTLYILSFCSAFIVGFSLNHSLLSGIIAFVYIAAVSITVHLIVDASNPRSGLINTQGANEMVKEIILQIKE